MRISVLKFVIGVVLGATIISVLLPPTTYANHLPGNEPIPHGDLEIPDLPPPTTLDLPQLPQEPSRDVGPGALLRRLRGIAVPLEPTPGAIMEGGALTKNPIRIAGQVVRGALALLGLIFFTLMIYGGSLYLTAGGNEEQVKKAVHVLTRAVIGGLIVIFAGAITQFLTSRLRQRVTPTPASGVTESCPRGPAYPAEREGIDFGCEPGYTLSGFTCGCSR